MTDKSSKSDFNASGGSEKPKAERNYSHKEIIEKTDRYATAAKTGKQLKDMLDIKMEHVDGYLNKAENRAARNRNFQLGIRAGIHPRETIEKLEKLDKEQDQRDRNRTMGKAKDYYHRNYSLAKTFNEADRPAKAKSKDKPMDKG